MGTNSQAEMDDVLGRHFAAEAQQDLEGITATLSTDAIHDAVGDPAGALQGHDAIRGRYEQMFVDLEAEDVTPIRRLYGDGFVVDECLYRARATGTPFGFVGGNREVEFRLLHVCTVADGEITHEQVWFDMAAVAQQLAGQ